MAAPIGNSIKLNTVRKLHLVALVEPPSLFVPLGSLSPVPISLLSARLDISIAMRLPELT